MKRPRIVGQFIRERREELGLSQKALGQLFEPAVTTQFISNVERGVTPLPPPHVPTLARALKTDEAQIMALLEREYALKLTGRLGRESDPTAQAGPPGAQSLTFTQPNDFEFFRKLYDAWRKADDKAQQAFLAVCESMLGVQKGKPETPPEGSS